MRYINMKTATGDMRVSCAALGTHAYGNSLPDAESIKMINMYLEAGGNIIDTARAKEYGRSEELLRGWMRSDSSIRKSIILSTKCCNHYYGKDVIAEKYRLTEKDMADDVSGSLEHLGTDYFDILWVHKDDPSVDAGEVIEWINKYVKDGTARHIGASNWSAARLHEANTYAEKHGLRGFEFSQIPFSLYKSMGSLWGGHEGVTTWMDDTQYEWYKKTQMPVFAFNSQAYGFFYKNFTKPAEEIEADAENIHRLERVRELCRRRGLTPQDCVLGYFAGIAFPTVSLVTSTDEKHMKLILDGLSTALSPEETEYLAGGKY